MIVLKDLNKVCFHLTVDRDWDVLCKCHGQPGTVGKLVSTRIPYDFTFLSFGKTLVG